MKQLKKNYQIANEFIDQWEIDINKLSKSIAKGIKDVIINSASYKSNPTHNQIKRITDLYDTLLMQYKEDNTQYYKLYDSDRAMDVYRIIFNEQNDHMSLNILSDRMTEEAKEEIKYLERLYNLMYDNVQNLIGNDLYLLTQDIRLPERISIDSIERTEKGLVSIAN